MCPQGHSPADFCQAGCLRAGEADGGGFAGRFIKGIRSCFCENEKIFAHVFVI